MAMQRSKQYIYIHKGKLLQGQKINLNSNRTMGNKYEMKNYG